MVTRPTLADQLAELHQTWAQLKAQVWALVSQPLCALLRRLPGRGTQPPPATPQRLSVVQPATTQDGLGTKDWGVDTYRRMRAADPLLYPTDGPTEFTFDELLEQSSFGHHYPCAVVDIRGITHHVNVDAQGCNISLDIHQGQYLEVMVHTPTCRHYPDADSNEAGQ